MRSREVTPIPKRAAAKTKRENARPAKTADAIFAKQVTARGQCESGRDGCQSTTALQCAHGFSRRYRATRWDHANAFCLCRRCHFWYTLHPLEWDDWMRDRLGPLYDELRTLALSGPSPKPRDILAALRKREAR